MPDIPWVICDIAQTPAQDWQRHFAGADVVVNASGALQTGAHDDLNAIHDVAIGEMVAALGGTKTRFIQISAAGAAPDAPTDFMRSKAAGDARLMGANLDWVILRPTLVLAPAAYGGTALLRAVASLPVGVDTLPDAPVQTVFIDDVTGAVVRAAQGAVPTGTIADLTEAPRRSFADTTDALRSWLGYAPWGGRLRLPAPILAGVGVGADVLGWLSWRSPLRRNALRSLAHGVTGDASAWNGAGGPPCRPLPETLAAMPATQQDRWFARMFLLLPMAIATLSLFWLLSGVIGALNLPDARAVLTSRGFAPTPATLFVLLGSVADVVLGLMVLVRRWARVACWGMIALSLMYLAGATVWATDLWADPLGPLVKVIPSLTLATITAALLGER